MARYEKSAALRICDEYFAESARILRELRAEGDLAKALWEWGDFLGFDCDDFERACPLLEEAERLYRKLGSWYMGGVQANLAHVYWRLGQPERARQLFQQALATIRLVDDQWDLMMLLAYQGEMEMELASDSAGLKRAKSILLEDLEIARKFGSKTLFVAYISTLLGKVAQKQCRHSEAIEQFREALSIVQQLGLNSWSNIPRVIGSCLIGLAEAVGGPEHVIFSTRLLGALQGFKASMEVFRDVIEPADFERVTAAARSQLDEAAFQSAWNVGQAMTLEEAIVHALKEFP